MIELSGEYNEDVNRLTAEIERYRDEVKALKVDADRYRLMRKLTLAQIDDTQEEFDAEFDRQTK